MRVWPSFFALCASALFAAEVGAEEPAAHRLTLAEAFAHALEHNPRTETATSVRALADAKVGVAKSDAVPNLAVVGQVNRSTGNVVPGATFGMAGLPGIQGPPGTTRSGSGTWQSIAGATLSWDVLELARRPVIVGAAEKDVETARAQADLTRVVVVADTADLYLRVVAADAVVTAAEASTERLKTFRDVAATLVGNKLRPDIDLARAETELSAARVAVEKARLGSVVARVALAESIGETSWAIETVDADFSAMPPAGASSNGEHPAVLAYENAAAAATARASVAKLARLPKVELAGAAWLRGGGYVLGGPNSGVANGLLPDTPNWAVGVVATWTPGQILTAGARAEVEGRDASVNRARADEVRSQLSADKAIAHATVTTAVAVAKETAAAVLQARRAVDLATVRYTTGNGNVVEVADAERARVAADRDAAVARIDVWRAFVAVCRAEGNMDPVLGGLGKAKG